MPAVALLAPPAPPPVLIAPGPYEVSYGRVAGRVGAGAQAVTVRVDGRIVTTRDLPGRRTFDFSVALPQRDARLSLSVLFEDGRRSTTSVGPVFGLPAKSRPRGPPARTYEDTPLARSLRSLARSFSGTCAMYVQDLRTGAGAAWNARARFPAASTLKVAIAIEVLRVLRGKPLPGSRIDRLLRKAIIPSDDRAANELLIWLGGTTSGGASRVNAIFRALEMADTDMYGGYIVPSRNPIPLRAEQRPSFIGKRTTAWDYSRLLLAVHQAGEGKGALARRYRGSFVPSDARFLLYLLAHTHPGWLDRSISGRGTAVLQKAGWISKARHDGGIVYSDKGAFLVTVMTWNPRKVGASSIVLAERVAQTAFTRFN
jgi:beta-lactamase family protein